MDESAGVFLDFRDYLQRASRPREGPTLWRWDDVLTALAARPGAERGSLALARRADAEEPSAAPGVSLVVQEVPPCGRTRPHAHSFWHICLVRRGVGVLLRGDGREDLRFNVGDVFSIPAWREHSFVNESPTSTLILLTLQNLPALANSGALARSEEGGQIRIVYSEQSRHELELPRRADG